MAQTQTHIQADGHCDLETESAEWADLVEIILPCLTGKVIFHANLTKIIGSVCQTLKIKLKKTNNKTKYFYTQF